MRHYTQGELKEEYRGGANNCVNVLVFENLNHGTNGLWATVERGYESLHSSWRNAHVVLDRYDGLSEEKARDVSQRISDINYAPLDLRLDNDGRERQRKERIDVFLRELRRDLLINPENSVGVFLKRE